jgi:hypothetical protein
MRDILCAEGLEETVGCFGRRISLADAIDEFQGKTGTGGQPAPPARVKNWIGTPVVQCKVGPGGDWFLTDESSHHGLRTLCRCGRARC